MNRTFYFFNFSAWDSLRSAYERTFRFSNSSDWARPHSAYEPYWVNRKNETGSRRCTQRVEGAKLEPSTIEGGKRDPGVVLSPTFKCCILGPSSLRL